ncbi:hypothetical protein ACET3Z_007351 [Daucus carota]|uniref:Acyl-[acyl-carrier-protein] hydrolase n=1 Tax=Daucus carota subsp. sativus TaxID=79200 RepID=A0A166EDZ4_DAUCS
MAACQSYLFSYSVWCSRPRRVDNSCKMVMDHVKINGTTSIPASCSSVTGSENGRISVEQLRQNIPTTKQLRDPYRQAVMIEEDVGYRQKVVIRSYEVGPDKTATIGSILNLLQETALNHVWMSGLLGDGFGATHGMTRNDLIWVVSRMHLQIDHYPIWGEVLELDTWVGASGKNGMRRDWQLRSHNTGIVYARATRRLSKMPDEVRAEIGPWFIEKRAFEEDVPEKIEKLDDSAKYVTSNLKAKRGDLDMNHHVNNVKYVGWMLETIPEKFMEENQLTSIILEYRRECGNSDVVQSLADPDEVGIFNGVHQTCNDSPINGYSLPSEILRGNGLLNSIEGRELRYTHLLQTKGEHKSEEIVRGRTIWKKKLYKKPFPP